LEDLATEALLELADQCEARLNEIADELERLAAAREVARRGLRGTGIKFGVNLGLALGGIAAAPPTGGLSLGLTVIGGLMLLWDGLGLGNTLAGDRRRYRRLADLRAEAKALNDELADIARVLAAR
jgi:hypothetical protein